MKYKFYIIKLTILFISASLFANLNTKFTVALTDAKFYKALGQTISNAIDWDGFRTLRGNKKSTNNDENNGNDENDEN